MLFATTLLSAAMISRAESTADSQPSAFTDLMSRLTGGAWDNSESASSDPTLGQTPPAMGGLNEPCYSGGRAPCNPGLHCNYWKSGGAYMGKCKHDEQPQGGEGEPCRDHTSHHHGRCNHGLDCVRKDMYPSGSTEICERIPTPPPAPKTGEAGGRCNKSPLSPCNHDNLKAHWQHILPHGEECICEYFLGGTASNQGTRLGARPPVFGVEGGACRNGDSYQPPCNDGLYCRYTTDGSAVFGKCEYLRGGLNERCYENGQCDYGLTASYDHLPGQALSYPVCKCRRSNGRLGRSANVDSDSDDNSNGYSGLEDDNSNGYSGENDDSKDDSSEFRFKDHSSEMRFKDESSEMSSTKVGLVAPKMGGLGEPCRNGESRKSPCDHGLYCELSYDESAVSGICVEGSANRRGGLNEDCYRDGTCDYGLAASYDHLGGQALAYPVCKCRTSSRPLGASNGNQELGASADASSTKLGLVAPEMGGRGQPCRNTPGNECNPGFRCHYTTDGSAFFGQCVDDDYPTFAREGQRCGISAGYDQPTQCEYGTYCKSERLYGCTHGPCTTHVCTAESRAQEGQRCGSSAGYDQPTQCATGLYCKSERLYGCTNGPCITRICTAGEIVPGHQTLAQKGDRCGSAAGHGQPTQCASGLYCKYELLLGCTHNCETYVCTENWLGDSGAASAPAPGN